MNTYQQMKLLTIITASEIRTLRGWEKKYAKASRKALNKGKNNSFFNELREEVYAERMAVRKDARAVHLAKSFLSNKDYKQVEQSTREGNSPDIEKVYDVLCFFGLSDVFSEYDIEEWISG